MSPRLLTFLHKFIMKYVKRKYIFYPFRRNETVKGSHVRLLSENAQRAIWLVTKAHQILSAISVWFHSEAV